MSLAPPVLFQTKEYQRPSLSLPGKSELEKGEVVWQGETLRTARSGGSLDIEAGLALGLCYSKKE